eukprot:jgi/Bigna1/85580/estExt_fgenesh1_pg.C_40415
MGHSNDDIQEEQEIQKANTAKQLQAHCFSSSELSGWTQEHSMQDDDRKLITGADLLSSLQLSEEECQILRKIPQRHTNGSVHNLWIDARRYRITASDFSSAAGFDGRSKSVVWSKVWRWNKFSSGGIGQEWGVRMEPRARMEYEERIKNISQDSNTWVEEVGIVVNPDFPWISCSPDGIIHTTNNGTGLLEIKCPLRRMPSAGSMPRRHWDQIQGSMGILGLDWCDYVIWMPKEIRITRYEFDRGYWNEKLLPNLKRFYLNDLLPALVLKENELLIENSLTPKHPLPEALIPKWVKEREKSSKGFGKEGLSAPRGKLLRRLEKKEKRRAAREGR